jgi:iron complex outermembrane receptor protein
MKTLPGRWLTGAFILLISMFLTMPLFAEEADQDGDDQDAASSQSSDQAAASAEDEAGMLEEILVTGSRSSRGRTATDSTVPIDSFNASDISQESVGDMTDTIRNLVPSYTATPLTGDGSSFVRSTSLRGLPPDNVLILVNSKRRHRSALIQHFGASMSSGSHAIDIGMIPGIALKGVEVLRDGAASQYGSDAIAGVINFILRDADEGGQAEGQFGRYYEGENAWRAAVNVGFSLGDSGFVNLSAEYTDQEQLIRGFQPAAAQGAVNAGVPGVGTDSPYSGDDLAQTWGRPKNHGLRTVWNMAYDLSDSSQIYMFGNYADTYGNYRFFYRGNNSADGSVNLHSSMRPIPIVPDDPSQGNFCWCEELPGGYTPYLEGDITDFSNILGIRGDIGIPWTYDLTINYGSNKIDYTLLNTLNPTFGPTSPREFDPGDLKEEDLDLTADFSYLASETVSVGFGAEWRREKYIMYAGSLESYAAGPWAEVGQEINPDTDEFYSTPPIGSNGMVGAVAESAGKFDRDNWAMYVDVEWDITDRFLVQGAIRYENYSDFGGTTNYKIASRYNVTDAFTIRGAYSTGFRAPTPGQSNYTGIVTTFDSTSGLQTQQGTVSPTSDLAVSLGGTALEPEDAKNISIGFTSNPTDNMTLTVDFYRIKVDDRIVKTQNLPVDDPAFSTVSFYTNALNTETTGLDIVWQLNKAWSNGSFTTFGIGYNYNKTKVGDEQNQVNGINPVPPGVIFNIEENLPKNRGSVSVVHNMDAWTFLVRANYYGKTIDERNNREPVGAATFVDLAVTYNFRESWDFTLGASNVFDKFPNKIDTRLGNGLAYPRRTPMGYDGGMWYLRAVYNW